MAIYSQLSLARNTTKGKMTIYSHILQIHIYIFYFFFLVISPRALDELEKEDFRRLLDVNVLGSFSVSKVHT